MFQTKGGYKSHWPQVGNLVTWDQAHVTYFPPSSPRPAGGVRLARRRCHVNDSIPQTRATAQAGVPAGHPAAARPLEKAGGRGGLEAQHQSKRSSSDLSCHCPCQPFAHGWALREAGSPDTGLVLGPRGEARQNEGPETAPTANPDGPRFLRWGLELLGPGLEASRTHSSDADEPCASLTATDISALVWAAQAGRVDRDPGEDVGMRAGPATRMGPPATKQHKSPSSCTFR